MRTRRLTIATVLLATAVAGTLSTAATATADDDSPVTRAAERYGVSQSAIRARLAEEPALRLAPSGAAFFVDPAPTGTPDTSRLVAPAFPLEDTFQLHSKPDSQRTIFLDFDGHTVSNTYWNTAYNVSSGSHPAMDLAGNGASFNATELMQIQDIWQRVAEDYAPFDVDVTTEEPPATDIDRANSSDQVYGTRALISPSNDALTNICGGACGGVAFIGVFNHYPGSGGDASTHAQYQPAWVFPQTLGQDVKNIAEATTHEVGHNLGLDHDGTSTQGYYDGHGGWAPIMGVGYDEPIVQFSLNDYPDGQLGNGSGNLQPNPDDIVTVTQFGAAQRTDEPGTSVGNAGPAPSTGYVSNRNDLDFFSVGTCAGTLTVTAEPAPVSPNLDIELALLSSGGATLDLGNPPSARVNRDVASGLGAQVSATVPSGTYYVRVDGVGRGNATNGYTDYGSVGSYTLEVTCGDEPPVNDVPDAPRIGEATPGRRGGQLTAKIRWRPPVADASPAIDGYEVVAYRRNRNGRYVEVARGLLPAAARAAVLTTQRRGSYKFAVRAHNAVGFGPLSPKSNAVRPR